MLRAIALVLSIGAWGSRPVEPAPPSAPPLAPPPPAPPPPPHAAPAPSPLDTFVSWVIAHDVDDLTYARGEDEADVTTTAMGATTLCRGHACFTVPNVDAVVSFAGTQLWLAPVDDPLHVVECTFAIRGSNAVATRRSIRDRVRGIGARPPGHVSPTRGRIPFDAIDAPPIGLVEALVPFEDALEVSVQTLHAGADRITLVSRRMDVDDAEAVVVVREAGTSRRSRVLHGPETHLEEVTGTELAGAFTVVRVSMPAGRGWSDELWSVGHDDVSIERVSIGGAEGDGQACDDERDGYCVWLTACERPLVVDDPTHAHLGPPVAWSALHRRLTDRWTYGTVEHSELHCPPPEVCVTPRGLTECEPD